MIWLAGARRRGVVQRRRRGGREALRVERRERGLDFDIDELTGWEGEVGEGGCGARVGFVEWCRLGMDLGCCLGEARNREEKRRGRRWRGGMVSLGLWRL